MAATARDLSAVAGLAEVGESLDAGIAALERATDWLLAHRGADSLAGATAYLRLAGDVIAGDAVELGRFLTQWVALLPPETNAVNE